MSFSVFDQFSELITANYRGFGGMSLEDRMCSHYLFWESDFNFGPSCWRVSVCYFCFMFYGNLTDFIEIL